MSTTEIRDLALQLPPDERALLARDLLSSLNGAGDQDNESRGEKTESSPEADAAGAGALNQITALTADLFQGPVTVKESCDPEFPGEKYVVFVAETKADNPTILKLEGQWNRQVTQLFPGWHGFRLSIRRKK